MNKTSKVSDIKAIRLDRKSYPRSINPAAYGEEVAAQITLLYEFGYRAVHTYQGDSIFNLDGDPRDSIYLVFEKIGAPYLPDEGAGFDFFPDEILAAAWVAKCQRKKICVLCAHARQNHTAPTFPPPPAPRPSLWERIKDVFRA